MISNIWNNSAAVKTILLFKYWIEIEMLMNVVRFIDNQEDLGFVLIFNAHYFLSKFWDFK